MRRKNAFTLAAVLLVPFVLQFGCKTRTSNTADNTAGNSATKTATTTATTTPAFKYDKGEFPKAKPWTSENFKNNPNNFQFAVIGDRSGGANVQGTYERAMDQLNLLQPEFVVSVGDFIEGYTSDGNELNREWDEFQGIVGKLQMPFFYVRGNHDVNFPATKVAWKERFGPDYYSFVYKNVLFVALDTEDAPRKFPPNMEKDIATFNRLKKEDPPAAKAFLVKWMNSPEAIEAFGQGKNKIEFPEAQRAWLKKTLAENRNVRWTFLFLHEPVWNNPSDSFKDIQDMLRGRKHTFFAGHMHYYDYDLIDGVEYITMGPVGAEFMRRGPGNVDHIMWVTMTKDGPKMANIALKGLYDRKGLDPAMFGAYDRTPPAGEANKEDEKKKEQK